MALEIERKFLINEILWNTFDKPDGLICKQTYLHKEIDKTIRVRVLGEKGFITFKGRTVGFTKPEFEYEIPLSDAKEMIEMFGELVIDKIRYIIPFKEHNWEVDVFFGDNAGLIVAEIELKSEDEHFAKPEWIDKEVTGDLRFSNSNLQSNPYKNWKHSMANH